jgi:hypothetical protein
MRKGRAGVRAAVARPSPELSGATTYVHGKERRMDTDLTGLHWFKSSASSTGGCVEIAHLPEGGVAVRDTKDRAKTAHVFNRHEWECFLIGAKNGEFDLPS